jgi:hypothetical protein
VRRRNRDLETAHVAKRSLDVFDHVQLPSSSGVAMLVARLLEACYDASLEEHRGPSILKLPLARFIDQSPTMFPPDRE